MSQTHHYSVLICPYITSEIVRLTIILASAHLLVREAWVLAPLMIEVVTGHVRHVTFAALILPESCSLASEGARLKLFRGR